jgi:hypothetical protein
VLLESSSSVLIDVIKMLLAAFFENYSFYQLNPTAPTTIARLSARRLVTPIIELSILFPADGERGFEVPVTETPLVFWVIVGVETAVAAPSPVVDGGVLAEAPDADDADDAYDRIEEGALVDEVVEFPV